MPKLNQRERDKRQLLKLYGENAIRQLQADLCDNCTQADFHSTACKHSLYPITLKGDPCPYYDRINTTYSPAARLGTVAE